MTSVRRPLGFGGIDQAAEFFGLPKREVQQKATSGQWPSYVIGGQRVFNFDEIIDLLVERSPNARRHRHEA